MNDKIREYFHRVESRDVDFMRKATIMALGDYILNTAGEDADLNGFGVRELNARHGSSWVLTRMAIEVDRLPDEHEQLRITTWVSDVSRVMTTRNFEVFGRDGVRIAAAVTNWAMINLSTRRPMDLHQLDNYNGMTQNITPPIELPHKLGAPVEERRHSHRVVYSDVDFNCHANSMKYLQWVVDTLPLEVVESRRFSRVDINFVQESRHGQLLDIVSGGVSGGVPESVSGDVPEGVSGGVSDSVLSSTSLFEILNDQGRTSCRIALTLI